MPSLFRYEYHWIENRVVEKIIRRPPNTKRWAFHLNQPTLIAVLEPDDNSFRVRRGPAHTDERLVDAVRHYEGLYTDSELDDFSKGLSTSLAKKAAISIKDMINAYAGQFRSFANEEDISGYVKGRLSDQVFEEDGTRIVVKAWTYARYPKETNLGIDLGIIFDFLRGERRVVKAIWIQAKRENIAPDDILLIKNLSKQLHDMLRRTSEAYVMIYTADGARMYRAAEPNRPVPVEDVFYESLTCERGDRDPVVIALTGDSKIVLNILIRA